MRSIVMRFSLLACLMASVCFFTSCSDDDDPTKDDGTTEEVEKTIGDISLLKGKWGVNGVPEWAFDGEGNLTFYEYGVAIDEAATYTYDEATHKLTMNTVEGPQVYIVTRLTEELFSFIPPSDEGYTDDFTVFRLDKDFGVADASKLIGTWSAPDNKMVFVFEKGGKGSLAYYDEGLEEKESFTYTYDANSHKMELFAEGEESEKYTVKTLTGQMLVLDMNEGVTELYRK